MTTKTTSFQHNRNWVLCLSTRFPNKRRFAVSSLRVKTDMSIGATDNAMMVKTAVGNIETAPFLQNRYWVLRHGRSIPNEKGIIVSSLENGTRPEFQLTREGVKQAKLAGELFLEELNENKIPIEEVRLFYSPFSRTRQTAEVVASVLNIPFEGPQCLMMEDLRERYFGPSFEFQSDVDNLSVICALDDKDLFKLSEGGESVDDVARRLACAVATIESEFHGCSILIVSHGDPLQILQTLFDAIKQTTGSNFHDLRSMLQAVRLPKVLTKHRNFALLNAQLRRVI